MTVEIECNGFIDLRGLPGRESLEQCMNASSVIYQGRIDGEVACIWGLVPPTVMSTQVYIWLYTTEIADKHTFILVRASQRMVEELLKEYDAITGHCRIDDERAIRWIRWLGAEFGSFQGKLVPFVIRRK
jgi:hypothetical protein